MEILRLRGHEARPFVEDLAHLRLKVFWDFPYLYEGTLDYEKHYLETYFKARNSFLVLIRDQNRIVGATTSILADEEEESFKEPFIKAGLSPRNVFYFGESVLLSEYRGKGIGKIFFKEREAFARSLGQIEVLSFCAVVREANHPLKPQDYTPLDTFWQSQGFHKAPNLTTTYEWTDRGEATPTRKNMQFWIKEIK